MSAVTTRETSSPEQSLAFMSNMFMVLTKSNEPLQQEISKTAKTFQTFMDEMGKNFEALSKENTQLREQLAAAESRNKEAEQLHRKQMQASEQLIKEQQVNIKTMNNRITELSLTLEEKFKALESRLEQHTHPVVTRTVWINPAQGVGVQETGKPY